MSNLDNYKQDTPEDSKAYECPECGKSVDKEGECSDDCFKASML